MQRHQSYTMPYSSTTPSSKYSSSHNTSSAFSASANPNEDWTKISDLAERRRIQNRIAQRNYRKKIKRRLEDLEKRASSSPERAHAELVSNQRSNDASKRRRSKTESQASQRQRLPEPVSGPYSVSSDGKADFSPESFGRELSVSPPPVFGSSYSLPEPNAHAPFYQPSNVHSLPSTYPEYSAPQYYLPPLPTTLPSMSSFEASKPGYYEGEEMFTQYNASNYAPFTSIELPMQQSYPGSNIHTPPLSHSHSFDHSRDGSPSIPYPGTPVSIPDSPKLMFR